MSSIINHITHYTRKISWPLLFMLLFVLNVKLVIKIAALLVLCIYNRRQFRIKELLNERYLWFYILISGIGLLNLAFYFKSAAANYWFVCLFGIMLWVLAAAASWNSYQLIKKEPVHKIHETISLFFILHGLACFLRLFQIMLETGSLNPFRFKGLNQKYFIDTGDYISGISFDAPVPTAFICAFGLLYALYNSRYLLSLFMMATMLLLGSNLVNLALVSVLAFVFLFASNRIQKSFIGVYLAMLAIFMVKVSPQNFEHTGRMVLKFFNRSLDVKIGVAAPVNPSTAPAVNKDSLRHQIAKGYIDSVSALFYTERFKIDLSQISTSFLPQRGDTQFIENNTVIAKVDRHESYLETRYDSNYIKLMTQKYNWESPGKIIAAKQLLDFYKQHKSRFFLGNGIGNFSSRTAFKATGLGIAGQFPSRYAYLGPEFREQHLYTYLHFFSRGQQEHTVANSPDSVYYQLLGEYGVAGFLCWFVFYVMYYLKCASNTKGGLALMLLLGTAFFVEYWYEQLSIVVLFELLFFAAIKTRSEKGGSVNG